MWNHARQRYEYEGVKFRTTNHDTIPMLIESGDVELLRILLQTGHMPQGLGHFDELGLNPAYLAITYDRPEILALLHSTGIDLSIACDKFGYGTPLFYAVYHANLRCLHQLIRLGVNPNAACTKFADKPSFFAKRHDPFIAAQLFEVLHSQDHAASRILRFIRRSNHMRHSAALAIQRQCRLFLSILRFRSAQTNLISTSTSGECSLAVVADEEKTGNEE